VCASLEEDASRLAAAAAAADGDADEANDEDAAAAASAEYLEMAGLTETGLSRIVVESSVSICFYSFGFSFLLLM
jgi:hypothetical protein